MRLIVQILFELRALLRVDNLLIWFGWLLSHLCHEMLLPFDPLGDKCVCQLLMNKLELDRQERDRLLIVRLLTLSFLWCELD